MELPDYREMTQFTNFISIHPSINIMVDDNNMQSVTSGPLQCRDVCWSLSELTVGSGVVHCGKFTSTSQGHKV